MTLAPGSSTIALKDGETYIYPLWKQLLNKWLSRDDCQVYVCTQHIDVDRLKDIVYIAYKVRQLQALNDGLLETVLI